jgi:hemin uptake protein HemP
MTSKSEPRMGRIDTGPAMPPPPQNRIVDSETLLAGAREIRITHNGESYWLRLTRLGKLILTK